MCQYKSRRHKIPALYTSFIVLCILWNYIQFDLSVWFITSKCPLYHQKKKNKERKIWHKPFNIKPFESDTAFHINKLLFMCVLCLYSNAHQPVGIVYKINCVKCTSKQIKKNERWTDTVEFTARAQRLEYQKCMMLHQMNKPKISSWNIKIEYINMMLQLFVIFVVAI